MTGRRPSAITHKIGSFFTRAFSHFTQIGDLILSCFSASSRKACAIMTKWGLSAKSTTRSASAMHSFFENACFRVGYDLHVVRQACESQTKSMNVCWNISGLVLLVSSRMHMRQLRVSNAPPATGFPVAIAEGTALDPILDPNSHCSSERNEGSSVGLIRPV